MGGSTSSELQISFNRSSLFYYAGEQIAGTIAFQNAQEKLTVDAIYLECTGEVGYTTQETRYYKDSNGHPRTEHYTKYHQIPFMTIRIPVAQPQYGQREITLYRGQHSWPFEFLLPQVLPPSFIPTTNSYPYVKYYARIVLDKPWYKPNMKQTYFLTIFPRVNLFHVPGGQQPVPFSNQNRKKIRVQGHLIRGGVVPGEKLSLQIQIQNPKRTEIKRIEATLTQHRHVARTAHTETVFRVDLPGLREFSGTELQQTFDLIVPPVHLSPTYSYLPQGYNAALGVSIHYQLVLDVKVRGIFTDFKLNIPVIVGTEPMSNAQQQEMPPPPIDMPIASAPAFEYDEPPPSYDSIVTDQKLYN